MERRRILALAAALALAGLVSTPALAGPPRQGGASPAAPAQGAAPKACARSVQLIPVRTQAEVRRTAARFTRSPVLAQDATTVIFADGRVVTSDVEAAGRHLNRLGWANRRIEVASAARSVPTRRGGG